MAHLTGCVVALTKHVFGLVACSMPHATHAHPLAPMLSWNMTASPNFGPLSVKQQARASRVISAAKVICFPSRYPAAAATALPAANPVRVLSQRRRCWRRGRCSHYVVPYRVGMGLDFCPSVCVRPYVLSCPLFNGRHRRVFGRCRRVCDSSSYQYRALASYTTPVSKDSVWCPCAIGRYIRSS